jgi:hypothetical protein
MLGLLLISVVRLVGPRWSVSEKNEGGLKEEDVGPTKGCSCVDIEILARIKSCGTIGEHSGDRSEVDVPTLGSRGGG